MFNTTTPFNLLTRQGWIVGGVAAFLLIGALLWAVLAWGQSRYDAGEADADARWFEASRKLEQEARQAGSAADRGEAKRIKDHTAQVAVEKEKIDEAVAEGSSPLDVLFGGM